VASAKAGEIEADIIMERFDPTLERYKSPYQRPANKIPLMDIWQAYVDQRSLIVSPTTLNTDFARVTRRLEACPVLISDSNRLKKWLDDNCAPGGNRGRLNRNQSV
jgi:integrase